MIRTRRRVRTIVVTFTIKDGKFADLVDTPDDGAAFDDFWS